MSIIDNPVFGTRLDYAWYHYKGTRHMDKRNPLDIDPSVRRRISRIFYVLDSRGQASLVGVGGSAREWSSRISVRDNESAVGIAHRNRCHRNSPGSPAELSGPCSRRRRIRSPCSNAEVVSEGSNYRQACLKSNSRRSSMVCPGLAAVPVKRGGGGHSGWATDWGAVVGCVISAATAEATHDACRPGVTQFERQSSRIQAAGEPLTRRNGRQSSTTTFRPNCEERFC